MKFATKPRASSSPQKGHSRPPQFSAHVWPNGSMDYGTPLCTEVGFGPGDIVIGEDPAPPTERGTTPPPSAFRPILLWHGRQSQQLLSSCQVAHTLNVSLSTISSMI